MSVEENKALIGRFVDGLINQHNLALVDELFAPEWMDRTPLPGADPTREGLKQLLTQVFAAFPDGQWTVEDMVAEGDKVAARYATSGTHKGEFMGIPATGKPISMSVFGIDRIAGGKFVESWALLDMLTMLQQLGAIPALDQVPA